MKYFLCLLLITTVQLNAAIITVVNGDNDGDGSFRDAVDQAVAGDEIQFDIGQVVLEEPVLIDEDITITGPVTLNGKNQTKIVEIISGTTVIIDDVRFINGNSNEAGGALAIEGNGDVTITNSEFVNNKARLAGGAIDMESGSTLSVSDTLFQKNESQLTGGAISVESNGEITLISNCRFVANKAEGDEDFVRQGGAIYLESDNDPSIIDLEDTLFENNFSDTDGGAIFSAAVITNIVRCEFSKNEATVRGGAIANEGQDEADGGGQDGEITLISDCDFSNNDAKQDAGGAIFNTGVITTIERTLFFKNDSNFEGGALFNDAPESDDRDVTAINNTTFSNNSSKTFGGAIFDKGGVLNFDSCTIAFNKANVAGGGIAIDQENSTVALVNTIVAKNNAPVDADVSGNNYDVGNNNLIEDPGNSNFVDDDGNNNIIGENPLLAGLKDNGGETKTRAIAANSPARDVGLTDLAEDQRAFGRPDPINNLDDIGAFEFGAVEVTTVTKKTVKKQVPVFSAVRNIKNVEFLFQKGFGLSVLWTEKDDDVVAFNVLRKTEDKEDFFQMNAMLIMATPKKSYVFEDNNIESGKRYFYRFQCVCKNGKNKLTKPFKIIIPQK